MKLIAYNKIEEKINELCSEYDELYACTDNEHCKAYFRGQKLAVQQLLEALA